MLKTIHVIPNDGKWAVRRLGDTSKRADFSTQREAIRLAKAIAKGEGSSQLVVHGLNGLIREYHTYGIPRIQDPPCKKSARIERAVSKITRARLGLRPTPALG